MKLVCLCLCSFIALANVANAKSQKMGRKIASENAMSAENTATLLTQPELSKCLGKLYMTQKKFQYAVSSLDQKTQGESLVTTFHYDMLIDDELHSKYNLSVFEKPTTDGNGNKIYFVEKCEFKLVE